jgi:hypothetical protein
MRVLRYTLGSSAEKPIFRIYADPSNGCKKITNMALRVTTLALALFLSCTSYAYDPADKVIAK